MKPLVNAPLIPDHPLSRGMKYRWLTNEGAGRRAGESVTGSAPVNTQGTPWAGSPTGRTLRFNGSSNYATAALKLAGVQRLTVAFNYYRATAPSTPKIVGELSANSNTFLAGSFYIADGYAIATDSSGAFFSTGLYADQSGMKVTGATIARPAGGIRHRIMLVYDRTLSSNQITAIYVNGVPQNITYGTVGPAITAPSTFRDDTFYFMARGGASLFAAGDADDWTFWTRCLTPTEAKADFADPYQMFDRLPATGIWVPSEVPFISLGGNQAIPLPSQTATATVFAQASQSAMLQQIQQSATADVLTASNDSFDYLLRARRRGRR